MLNTHYPSRRLHWMIRRKSLTAGLAGHSARRPPPPLMSRAACRKHFSLNRHATARRAPWREDARSKMPISISPPINFNQRLPTQRDWQSRLKIGCGANQVRVRNAVCVDAYPSAGTPAGQFVRRQYLAQSSNNRAISNGFGRNATTSRPGGNCWRFTSPDIKATGIRSSSLSTR